jgi:hypothetical protein
MRTALLVTLLVAVLLSVAISYFFQITFVAVLTSLLLALKQFKVVWVFEWLLRFILIRLPQRIITSSFTRYFISSKRQQRIIEWFKRQQAYLQLHSRTRLVFYGIIAMLIMGVSIWTAGVWLLFIYELPTLARMIWDRIWPTLSETAFMKAINRLLVLLAPTKAGQLFLRVLAWFRHHFEVRVEETGEQHQEQVVKAIEEVLTGILASTRLCPPPLREVNRYDLRHPTHPHKVTRREAKSRHGGYRPLSPRPKR